MYCFGIRNKKWQRTYRYFHNHGKSESVVVALHWLTFTIQFETFLVPFHFLGYCIYTKKIDCDYN